MRLFSAPNSSQSSHLTIFCFALLFIVVVSGAEQQQRKRFDTKFKIGFGKRYVLNNEMDDFSDDDKEKKFDSNNFLPGFGKRRSSASSSSSSHYNIGFGKKRSSSMAADDADERSRRFLLANVEDDQSGPEVQHDALNFFPGLGKRAL